MERKKKVGDKKEYILCAAIWYKELKLKKTIEHNVLPRNCDKGLVFCGHRHPQCMYTMVSITGLRSVIFAEDAAGEHEQGFLTNLNRFVDREEGAKIAYDADQTEKELKTLYSEDLY